MSPLNRLNVRGMRTCGFTSISVFFAVWMYTSSRPALFSGESSSVNKHWCVMSGRASAMSRPVFARMPWWSSQLSSAYLASPSRPPRPLPTVPTRYASKHACSSTTNSRRWPGATRACAGSSAGFACFASASDLVFAFGSGRVGRGAPSGAAGAAGVISASSSSSSCVAPTPPRTRSTPRPSRTVKPESVSISAYLANEGRAVSVVFDRTDAFTAGSRPLPDFIRKSRFLSLFSPHIHLRTVLERFLHTTTLGKKIVDWFWHGLADSSLHPAGVPADSPIRRTFSPFWSVRINDEGVPRANGFHALANAGKIALVAPARVAGFGEDGRSVVLEDGRTLRADAVVLATGYRSSWPQMFDGQTLEDLALRRHAPVETTAPPHWGYTTLSDPPPQPTHSQAQQWSTSIYRGLVPAPNILRRDLAVNGAVISPNNGYTVEVAAPWISSYFLGDAMRLPTSPEEALQETARNAAWLKVRYPDTAVAMNESHTNSAAFWTWPQHVDDLLEDMGLPVMRSGGNWLTWPFKVVDLEEIRELKGERDARRARRA